MFRSKQNGTTKTKATENSNTKVAWPANDTKKSKNCDVYRTIMKDFLQNTSLHGLKYIGYTRFTIFER